MITLARLPSRESLGNVPSLRSGRAITRVDLSAPARAQANLGQNIVRAGAAFAAAADQVDPATEFETERRFQEFKYQRELDLEKSMQEMQPGQAGSFADSVAENYKTSAAEFFKTIPEPLRGKYDLKLFDAERNLYRGAATFGRNEQKRASVAGIEDFKNKYLARPGNLDRGKTDYESLVNANPFLTPIEKDKLRREGLRDLEKTHLRGLIERGEGLESIEKDLGFGPELDTDENPELRAKPFSKRSESPDSEAELLFSPKVNDAIAEAAKKHGVDPGLLATFAKIESGGRPGVQTGSYKGLFQLSSMEFRKHGGEGNIFDPAANADAAAAKLKTEAAEFEQKYGRAPTPLDLYLIHQQGEGGYEAHIANPERAAWESMASTAEGREKGERWAKQAIWGNIPDDVKSRFPGGVESVTSGDFVELWREKVDRLGGGEVRVAQAEGPKSDAYSGPYANLSAEDRRELAHSARSKRRASLEIHREQLKQQLDDDVRSVRETGVSTNPDIGTAAQVLEGNQINRYRINRKEAEMEFNAMRDLPSLPEAELQRRLDEAEPKPGEQDYEIKAKVFDKVNRAITGNGGIRELRENDPASAVSDLPEVKQATLVLRENPENPEAIQNLARARVDAQAKVGIPEQLRTPITKSEARVLMAPLKNLEGKALQEGFTDVHAKLQEQYGPYARAAAVTAIEYAVKSKDMAEEIEGLVSKALSGQRVTSADQRRFERIAEITQAERAFGFVGEPSRQFGAEAETSMPFQPDVMQSFGMRRPPQRAVEALRANPALAAEFNAHYAAGGFTAEQILAGQE